MNQQAYGIQGREKGMIEHRRAQRTAANLPIVVATVLTRRNAMIVDISESGAQITGCSLDQGSRFMIERGEETVYATVAWSEVDRMGVRFDQVLQRGDLLNIALRTKTAARLGNDVARRPVTFGRKAQ